MSEPTNEQIIRDLEADACGDEECTEYIAAQRLRALEAERGRLREEVKRLGDELEDSGEHHPCERCGRVFHENDMGHYVDDPNDPIPSHFYVCNDCEAAQQGGG